MPSMDEPEDPDDPQLWFSHSTEWMIPLCAAGKIPPPPACFQELKVGVVIMKYSAVPL